MFFGTERTEVTIAVPVGMSSLTISGSGEMVTTDRFMWSDYPIKNLVISEGVTSIAEEAFYSNHSLKGQLKLPG